MQISLATLSRLGARARNEDACGYWGEAGPICCVLADGAGGHEGGDVASHTAVAAVLDAFTRDPDSSPDTVRRLIEIANQAVLDRQAADPAVATMRATLVVFTCDPARRRAAWGHVGDSRLYHLRGDRILSQTRDHSLYQSMIDAGLTVPMHDGRVIGRSILVSALGAAELSMIDVVEGEVEIAPGDTLFICSDGLWEHFDDDRLIALCQEAESAEAWLERLDELVREAGSPTQDNYSAIVVWCRESAAG